MGGGDALARQMRGRWDRERTVVLGLDGLSGGQLTFLETEGEVTRMPIPAWLARTCREVAAADPRFAEVDGFDVPVGGSDVAPFLYRGYQGVCLARVDRAKGAPHHYHQPSDTPDHLDLDQVLHAIDYAEALVRTLWVR